PPPNSESKQTLASRLVRMLFDLHGVPSHKHSTAAAEILKLSYRQAHRKVQEDAPWTLEELQTVAEHFGITLADLVAGGDQGQAAVLLTGGARVPCRLWVGQELAPGVVPPLVTFRSGADWLVGSGGQSDRPGPHYAVQRLVVGAVQLQRRVAIL